MSATPNQPTGAEFNTVAGAYDLVRPDYPPETIGALMRHANLGRGSRVVEAGAGTGILTRQLLEQGLLVTAVEPGNNMRDVLVDELEPWMDSNRLRVVDAAFLDAAHDGEYGPYYDAVIAGTSWPWLGDDRTAVNRLAHNLLRPPTFARAAGCLAILQNTTAVASADLETYTLQDQLQIIYEMHLNSPLEEMPYREELTPDTFDQHLFELAHFSSVVRHSPLRAGEYANLVRTYGPVARLEPKARAGLLRDLTRHIATSGGFVLNSLATTLTIARRRGEPEPAKDLPVEAALRKFTSSGGEA